MRVHDHRGLRILTVDDAVEANRVVEVGVPFEDLSRKVDHHDVTRPQCGERWTEVIYEHAAATDGDADVTGVGRAQAVSIEKPRGAAEIEPNAVVIRHDCCATARASSRNSLRR